MKQSSIVFLMVASLDYVPAYRVKVGCGKMNLRPVLITSRGSAGSREGRDVRSAWGQAGKAESILWRTENRYCAKLWFETFTLNCCIYCLHVLPMVAFQLYY